jgi:hypothetical protein
MSCEAAEPGHAKLIMPYAANARTKRLRESILAGKISQNRDIKVSFKPQKALNSL